MRTLVISDTHFGALTADDLLAHGCAYEPRHGDPQRKRRYRQRGWPGTAVLVDTEAGEPQLVEMLADRNPLAA